MTVVYKLTRNVVSITVALPLHRTEPLSRTIGSLATVAELSGDGGLPPTINVTDVYVPFQTKREERNGLTVERRSSCLVTLSDGDPVGGQGRHNLIEFVREYGAVVKIYTYT